MKAQEVLNILKDRPHLAYAVLPAVFPFLPCLPSSHGAVPLSLAKGAAPSEWNVSGNREQGSSARALGASSWDRGLARYCAAAKESPKPTGLFRSLA